MTDLLVLCFSKDRAFQLDGLLRSYRLHCGDNAPPVTVLFRCSNARHREQYRQVERENPGNVWVEETNFGTQVVDILERHKFVLFLTDDSLFVRDVDLDQVVEQLLREQVLGVSLRLGINCKTCYPVGGKPQATPEHDPNTVDWFTYDWTTAELDWGYPFEVSSSVYRMLTVWLALGDRRPHNPNKLEFELSRQAESVKTILPRLACPKRSACFGIPWNRTGDSYQHNRASGDPAHSVEALSALYAIGERLDVAAYSGFVPESCHQEVDLRVLSVKRKPRRPIVVVSTARDAEQWIERCLESVETQTVEARHVYVADGSATVELGQRLVRERGWNAKVRQGTGSHIENLIEAISGLVPETIVVWLDGDDWLARNDALAIVAKAYENPNVWLTFGQFRWWPGGEPGFADEYPAEIIAKNSYRQWHWLATILRTFYAGLFQQLDPDELRLSNGTCVDQLVMLPLLELAGGRHQFIPDVLAEYNTDHFIEIGAAESEAERIELHRLRTRPPLKRLADCPWTTKRTHTSRYWTDELVIVSTGGGPNVAKWVRNCVRSIANQTLRCRHVMWLQESPEGVEEAQRTAKLFGHTLEVEHDPTRSVHVLDWWERFVASCPFSTILVLVDADDWLERPDAVEIVERAYHEHDCWLTFGQFRQWPPPGLWPDWQCTDFSAEEIAAASYRDCTWRTTHLKTFRAGLYQYVRRSDQFAPDGRYLLASDQSVMLAMLELANGRHRFIPDLLYTYNCAHSLEATKPEQVEQRKADSEYIRTLPRYAPLEVRPW